MASREKMRKYYKNRRGRVQRTNAGEFIFFLALSIAVVATAHNIATIIFGGLIFIFLSLPAFIDLLYFTIPGRSGFLRSKLSPEKRCAECNGWGRHDRPICMRIWFKPTECLSCQGSGTRHAGV